MRADSFQAMTIGRGIRCAAARSPEKAALISGDRHLSYRELVRRMARVANMGRTHFGLKPGDRAILLAPNTLSYIELVAGLSDIGVIVATLSPRLTSFELREIVADCEPRLIVADPSCAALLVQEAWADDIPVLELGKPYEALIGHAADTATDMANDEEAPFALAYTSGTTGQPKGVLLPHRSRAITFLAMAAEYRCFGVDDNFLAMAPMCHGAGFVFACAALFFNGTTTLFDERDPAAMLSRMTRSDVSGIFVVPTQLARLFDLPQATLDAHRNHKLTTMISNAAALPQALKERSIDQFGDDLLHETYGSTEGGIVTNIRPRDLVRKPNSVGVPFPGVEVELRTNTGGIAAIGDAGELYCRSPASFAGYWRRPQETAAAVVDGWVTVGDIACRDSDSYITIVDRKKDMIVTGGMNVYPREIENVIAALPDVREVAVVGAPDAEWGESVHAFIIPRTGGTIDEQAVMDACRERLAGFKIPRRISLIDELPRNAGGKVLKGLLRERAV